MKNEQYKDLVKIARPYYQKCFSAQLEMIKSIETLFCFEFEKQYISLGEQSIIDKLEQALDVKQLKINESIDDEALLSAIKALIYYDDQSQNAGSVYRASQVAYRELYKRSLDVNAIQKRLLQEAELIKANTVNRINEKQAIYILMDIHTGINPAVPFINSKGCALAYYELDDAKSMCSTNIGVKKVSVSDLADYRRQGFNEIIVDFGLENEGYVEIDDLINAPNLNNDLNEIIFNFCRYHQNKDFADKQKVAGDAYNRIIALMPNVKLYIPLVPDSIHSKEFTANINVATKKWASLSDKSGASFFPIYLTDYCNNPVQNQELKQLDSKTIEMLYAKLTRADANASIRVVYNGEDLAIPNSFFYNYLEEINAKIEEENNKKLKEKKASSWASNAQKGYSKKHSSPVNNKYRSINRSDSFEKFSKAAFLIHFIISAVLSIFSIAILFFNPYIVVLLLPTIGSFVNLIKKTKIVTILLLFFRGCYLITAFAMLSEGFDIGLILFDLYIVYFSIADLFFICIYHDDYKFKEIWKDRKKYFKKQGNLLLFLFRLMKAYKSTFLFLVEKFF